MHSKESPKTAVLYFSRNPNAESKYKVFTDDCDLNTNCSIASLLEGHIRSEILKSGLPFFHFDEKRQRGATFGERLSNAFDDLFRKGYESVIAVGNDTPQLTASHLQQAQLQLETGQSDMVLGPSHDGGTWLMAFSREAFFAIDFISLPWKTSDLMSALIHASGLESHPFLFEYFSDIDTPADLRRFLRTRSQSKYLSILQLCVWKLLRPGNFKSIKRSELVRDQPVTNLFSRRAPPKPSDSPVEAL